MKREDDLMMIISKSNRAVITEDDKWWWYWFGDFPITGVEKFFPFEKVLIMMLELS